jgi:hypothetical protein
MNGRVGYFMFEIGRVCTALQKIDGFGINGRKILRKAGTGNGRF